MGKRTRIWGKTILILAGLFLFCLIVGRRQGEPGEPEDEKAERIREYERDESVEKVQTTLLAYGEWAADGIPEDAVLTTEGAYPYQTAEAETLLYKQVTAYIRDGEILEVAEAEEQTETLLSNLFLLETGEDKILCFWDGCSFYLPFRVSGEDREQVADVVLCDGAVRECRVKKEKVTGKLLGVTKESVSLPDKTYPLADDTVCYRLYGEFQEIPLTELAIGYDNTDFVLEDGRVCACLVGSQENMEKIRVLIQSGNYAGRYHESVALTGDSDFTLSCGEETQAYGAGEYLELTAESAYFENGDRIILTPSVNTGRLTIFSIQRGRERADYRGSLEILRTPEGLAVINELPLEEYLYGVTPSEMPASYPEESLKAQAVCARTYAYGNMIRAGLPELGAHVDDSTAFQVYGNTEERAETTAAVKATKGELLLYGGEPISAYYYSTSCGYGTDLRAWNGPQEETLPYLGAKRISDKAAGEDQKEDIPAPGELQEEAAFEAFIRSRPSDCYESGEAWYRWQYTVDTPDIAEMEERLLQRYQAHPEFILTRQKGGDYISQKPGRIGTLQALTIVRRNPGGSAAQLLIEGSEGSYLAETEYNIRYLLNNGAHPVIRGDGSKRDSPLLLPSAFLMIELDKTQETVAGYTVTGGGYGHGIGMSQNGAKHMALCGKSAEEILRFFYEGSETDTIY